MDLKDLLAQARDQRSRLEEAVYSLGLKYVVVPDETWGCGIAVAFGENDFCTLSITMANPAVVTISSGVLKNLQQHDEVAALRYVNKQNIDNSNFMLGLFQAPKGWSLLICKTEPLDVVLAFPQWLGGMVRGLPQAASEIREGFLTQTSSGGQPYSWTEADLVDLHLRSIL